MNVTILVADDDPVQRRLLDAMVRRFGYDVETVESGEAALERLQATDKPAISVLVLDLVMPDLDGMGVLERMKERNIAVPVIVQTIRNTPEFAALLPERLVIIAFDENVVAACKRSMPDVKALWLTGFKADEITGKLRPSMGAILETLARIQADGLDCKASEHIDKAFVQQLRGAGYEFHVWTVDEPETAARFQRLGVDSITTNRPAFIRKALMLEPVIVP